MEDTKFKVGDRVRCVKTDDYDSARARVGDILTVSGMRGPALFVARHDGEPRGLWNAGHFEKVETTTPPREFQKGDMVRLKRSAGARPTTPAGTVVKIIALPQDHPGIGENCIAVGVPGGWLRTEVSPRENGWWVPPTEVELVTPVEDIPVAIPAPEPPAEDKALAWLKDNIPHYDEGTDGAVLHRMLREVFNLEAHEVPASFSFVPVSA